MPILLTWRFTRLSFAHKTMAHPAIYPIATQAEAEAGLVNNRLMTPLRTAQAITALGGGGGIAVADGIYTVGLGITADGKLTISGGELTAIQEAAP
jgi:hypothetical protein